MAVREVSAPRHFRLALPPVSGLLRPRLIAVCLGLTALTFLVVCVSLSVGDFSIGLVDVVKAVAGKGDPGNVLIIRQLRLPRVATGLLVGIAFALSGALFQTMTRNPMASSCRPANRPSSTPTRSSAPPATAAATR